MIDQGRGLRVGGWLLILAMSLRGTLRIWDGLQGYRDMPRFQYDPRDSAIKRANKSVELRQARYQR